MNNSPCGKDAICRNTPGAFECVCPASFTGDAYNECKPLLSGEQITCDSDRNSCAVNEECVNNGKANQCVCRRGYSRDPETSICKGN